jgi:hypothetical protein
LPSEARQPVGVWARDRQMWTDTGTFQCPCTANIGFWGRYRGRRHVSAGRPRSLMWTDSGCLAGVELPFWPARGSAEAFHRALVHIWNGQSPCKPGRSANIGTDLGHKRVMLVRERLTGWITGWPGQSTAKYGQIPYQGWLRGQINPGAQQTSPDLRPNESLGQDPARGPARQMWTDTGHAQQPSAFAHETSSLCRTGIVSRRKVL